VSAAIGNALASAWIERLAADHAARARGAKQLERDLAAPRGGHCLAQGVEPARQHARGECHHVVASARRPRHVERAMRRRAAAPQVVVVHAGEIVVHQRVGVHHFHGGRQLRHSGRRCAVECLMRRKHQRRPQALPFAQQAVAHDVVSRRCRRQYFVDPGPGVRQIPS
jgi:hypothetical protein